MISPLPKAELDDIKKAWQLALGLLDIELAEGAEVNTEQMFASLCRSLEKARYLSRAKRPNEAVSLLGFYLDN